MKRLVHCLPLTLALAAVAHADVIHLNNGRTLEGKVVQKRGGVVTLKVPGGTLSIPQSTVERIEPRKTPHEEYGDRARRTDMSNPRALDALAHWSSARGLGEQALNLRAQARGIRLQDRVDRVRDSRFAQDYLEVYRWAKGKGYSFEVQRWLLDKALELEPERRDARGELGRLASAEGARAEALREREAVASRPARATSSDGGLELDSLRGQLKTQRRESAELRRRLDSLEKQDERLRRNVVVRRHRRRGRRSRRYGPRGYVVTRGGTHRRERDRHEANVTPRLVLGAGVRREHGTTPRPLPSVGVRRERGATPRPLVHLGSKRHRH